MTDNLQDGDSVEGLIAALSSDEPAVRQSARERLVEIAGEEVTRGLVRELGDPRQHVRWEAAKALAAIADPVAGPALMHAMEDDDDDVRWVAAKGLIAMRDEGLLVVLNGLTKRAISHHFCKSAHHVLHDLKESRHGELLAPVLKALDSSEPAVTAPPAAFKALEKLKGEIA